MKIIGYILFIFSILAWFSPFLVAFLPLSFAWKTFLFTTIIVLGEIAFVGSVVILGKGIWKNWKGIFRKKEKTMQ